MRKTPRIGCMGELLVELVCTSRNGRHRVVSSYLGPFPSGASGIFIDQAAQIGGRCFFVGALGDDAFGEVVRERLVEHGVDVSLVRTAKTWPTVIPSASAFVRSTTTDYCGAPARKVVASRCRPDCAQTGLRSYFGNFQLGRCPRTPRTRAARRQHATQI